MITPLTLQPFRTALVLGCLALFAPEFRGQNSTDTLQIHDGWQMYRTGENLAMPARVPGYTHETLLDAGIITDLNDERINVYSQYSYTYSLDDFGLPAGWSSYPAIDLVFEGIDTFAEVYLNDSLILQTSNYFTPYRLEVSRLLNKTGNSLKVVIESPAVEGEKHSAALAHPLPGEPIRAVARKPQYHYGWDWAPTITPSGIHKPVYLVAHPGFQLDYSEIRTIFIEGGSAILEYNGSVKHTEGGVFDLEVTLSDGFADYSFGVPVTLTRPGDGQQQTTEINHRFELKNPKLWWTHELGNPFLYQSRARLSRRSDSQVAEEYFKTGIRTVQLITDEDSDGATFTFRINGVSTFMRGANYVPHGIFEATVKDAEIIKILKDARAVNMNMLRVWGGGVYEREAFYEWCNENGVVVWQDFMYACSMYPGDEAFLAQAAHEAKHQVLRLRRHPCMALWCGNNEVSEGWWRWGWQDGLTPEEKTQIWQAYTDLFIRLLPEVVGEHSNLPYWETSPMFGRGDVAHTAMGDAHYWGVWHDAEAFEAFDKRVPRFMSEFGMQSMPGAFTMKHQWGVAVPDTTDAAVQKFQKHPRGFALLDQYQKAYYPPARDAHDWAYLSQLVQRDGVLQGIRAHRRSRPYCMGSLYWQLNDCWPAISWSSIDYSGEWKALHYALLSAFAPFHMWLSIQNGKVVLLSANDTPVSIKARYRFSIVGTDGTAYGEEASDLWQTYQPAQAISLWLNERQGYAEFARGEAFVLLEYEYKGRVHTQALFAGPMRLIPLPEAAPKIIETRENDGVIEYLIATEVFASNVRLDARIPGHFSDNYFDLPAGWEKWVTFTPAVQAEVQTPQIHCLNCP